MKTLLTVLPLLLLCCSSGDDVPPGDATSAPPVTRPAPGQGPQPAVSGDVSYTLMDLNDLRDVEGCTFLLWPENEESGHYVYGFNYGEGPAEGMFGGSFQTLEVVRENDNDDDPNAPETFVHANDDYEVTTTVTRERQVDGELWELSGEILVRERATGKTLQVKVLGEQGC